MQWRYIVMRITKLLLHFFCFERLVLFLWDLFLSSSSALLTKRNFPVILLLFLSAKKHLFTYILHFISSRSNSKIISSMKKIIWMATWCAIFCLYVTKLLRSNLWLEFRNLRLRWLTTRALLALFSLAPVLFNPFSD